MDGYAEKLADAVVEVVESDDSRQGYAYASGMRRALEICVGDAEARRLLFARGHEY